jgi:tRNA-splicing endonuclease subunit Sen2
MFISTMADITHVSPSEEAVKPEVFAGPKKPRGPSKSEQLNKLYALPAPLRTFPLPTLVPHNPLSLFHILYVWLSHTVNPQPSHFDPLYQGWFSPETRSIHVTDPRSIRGLWEQGFYGKGSLSRSEPSWLDREKTRRGTKEKVTSEEIRQKRRDERQQTKWERARKEREAIDQRLSDEAESSLRVEAESPPKAPIEQTLQRALEGPETTLTVRGENTLHLVPGALVEEASSQKTNLPAGSPFSKKGEGVPLVGPLELLALPNSLAELEKKNIRNCMDSVPAQAINECSAEDFDAKFVQRFYKPPVGPLELLALPNSIRTYLPVVKESPESLDRPADLEVEVQMNAHVEAADGVGIVPEHKMNGREAIEMNGLGIHEPEKIDELEIVGGSDTNDETNEGSVHSEETGDTSATPPNGSSTVNGALLTPKIKRRKSVRFSPTVEKNTFLQSEPPSPEHAANVTTTIEEEPLVIQDQEHIQLTLEEAFFLSYALGALTILDSETQSPISTKDLFSLCRRTSYFPPQANPALSPDDPFMVNYVVYHHFRSLGWVPRSGIKFSVDYMLYMRGPVFTHAEFAVLILASYSDSYWSSNPFLRNYVKGKQERTWAWMSCINRVITQVKKTLILAYVDIPRPLKAEEEAKMGIDTILKRYSIREVVMKRWSSTRIRD